MNPGNTADSSDCDEASVNSKQLDIVLFFLQDRSAICTTNMTFWILWKQWEMFWSGHVK